MARTGDDRLAWDPREYDIYNGVTQDMWFKRHGRGQGLSGRLAMQLLLRFHVRGFCARDETAQYPERSDPDDFNNMTFHDLFTRWSFGISKGKATRSNAASRLTGWAGPSRISNRARPGDFLSYSTTPAGGHAVIFILLLDAR